MDFLARMNTDSQIPGLMTEKMKDRRFLFLGYRMGDWNLRVFLPEICRVRSVTIAPGGSRITWDIRQ